MHKSAAWAAALLAVMAMPAWAAGYGSATGLDAVIDNCQNRSLDPDARIRACTDLIHANLVSDKMLAGFYTIRAEAYIQSKQDNLAMADYDKAISLFPDYTPALVNRAGLLYQQGAVDRALADLDQAIKAQPNEMYALSFRCQIRFERKDKNSLDDCDAAVRAAPDNERVRLVRGRLYEELGRCAEADADFAVVLKGDPTNPDALRLRAQCQQTKDGATAAGSPR